MGGNGATYIGMEIMGVKNEDFDGVVLDSNKYENKISQIEIPRDRMITPNELLKEAEQTILRSDLGKLMRIARSARPNAIYDASAESQTFSTDEMVEFPEEGVCSEDEEEENSSVEGEGGDSEHMPGFAEFKIKMIKGANKVNLLKNKKIDTSKTHFTVRSQIFFKKRQFEN